MSFLLPLRGPRGLPFHILLKCRPAVAAGSANQKSLLLSHDLNRPAPILPVATLTTAPKNRLLFSLSPDSSVVFVPKRYFGRGKRLPPYGHGYLDKPTNLELVAIVVVMFCLFGFIVDWRKIERDYGIKIPIIYRILLSSDPAPPTDRNIPSSAPLIFEEEKKKMHQFMQEESAKRVLEKSKSDPEIVAILEGREITPKDPEEFLLKQEFVRRIGEKTSLKAEEESAAATMTSATLDFKKFLNSGKFEEDDIAEDDEQGDRRVGFRHRKIIEYENRIRQYSTPDKIFRYFATYRVVDDKGHFEAMMTPDDFLRSITPGVKQPENLGLDHFISVSPEEITKLTPQLGVDENSIFHQFGSGGLLSFSDYIFLLTVLSTSRRHFEIAFKMFDLNGDGNVDAKEFEVVTNLMRSQSTTGIRHRDHQTTGSTLKGLNSGLNSYFFGDNRDGILTVEKFLDFQRRLQNEILKLEFGRKLKENRKLGDGETRISEKGFADLLIAYAGFPPKKKTRMLKRVKKAFGNEDEQQGIALEDFLSFYQVLYAINDIDTALTFHTIAGAPIERSTMKHVAQTVAGVQLSDHIIDVVFILFDENGDGKLSNKEFVSVMKQRALRGLEKPKDTGIGRIFSAMSKCAADSRPTVIGGVRKSELN